LQEADGFREYLRKKGKKSHVVEGLVRRCGVFEVFLQERKRSSMDEATKEDIQVFASAMNDRTGFSNYLRAVSLYYRFKSRPDLSAVASGLREQRMSLTRSQFVLKDFRGVKRSDIAALKKEGIVNVDQMLKRGRTPEDRKDLSKRTGVSEPAIIELVKLSDLARIRGVKSIRARLYYDAGIDTVEKMAQWDPDKLRATLIGFVERTGFDGIAPLPKEAKFTVAEAKRLPKIVAY
jgi:predicted flap endonuclease-1-like 5' DNA nuclease